MGHAKPGNTSGMFGVASDTQKSLGGMHRELVSSLSRKQPIFEELCQRMINFHCACICSYNRAIKGEQKWEIKTSHINNYQQSVN